MAASIVAETNPKTLANIDAIDTAHARLDQGMAVLSVLENIAMRAMEEKANDLELSPAQIAQTLWAARTLLEQAQEAVKRVTV